MKALRLVSVLAAVVLVAGMRLPAGEKTEGKVVDAGSFGVFVNGKRVATETFQVTEQSDGSHARAEFRLTDGASSQVADLHLLPNGHLRRYEWREESPKAQVVVELKNEFLVETVTVADSSKPTEIPFLLSASTAVVDDNFFLHRQILAWKYLREGCVPGTVSPQGCQLQRTQFGVIIPQQQRPSVISLEYTGPDKVVLQGNQRELRRFKLETEGAEWLLWLDEQYKMVRVLVAAQNIEVLRD
ncbi:MAG: hypothetical protein L0099_09170 [Acidobacteria bacterium]|nr:hypothetical protein [Acidobacteriota bacterium]